MHTLGKNTVKLTQIYKGEKLSQKLSKEIKLIRIFLEEKDNTSTFCSITHFVNCACARTTELTNLYYR